jgi:hypothetical protein
MLVKPVQQTPKIGDHVISQSVQEQKQRKIVFIDGDNGLNAQLAPLEIPLQNNQVNWKFSKLLQATALNVHLFDKNKENVKSLDVIQVVLHQLLKTVGVILIIILLTSTAAVGRT